MIPLKKISRAAFLAFSLGIYTTLCSFGPPKKGPQNKPKTETVAIIYQGENTGRMLFGARRLAGAIKAKGAQPVIIDLQNDSRDREINRADKKIYIGLATAGYLHAPLKSLGLAPFKDTVAEGFSLQSETGKIVIVTGADNSGALYGCLELADRIVQNTKGLLPGQLSYTDHPQMKLRGACIGLQKSYLLPGRGTYEYPITEANFPWFYNKQLWLKYLDMLVGNKMNTLYLWSGHPFASLVQLKDYPEAVEVDSATFEKNKEMYRFLTEEANKRGIWVIQAFYNIIVSKPFAEKHHIKTQDRNRPILPLIADYTRKSIAAFVKNYPNVGLLVTLGEAMEGVGPDDTRWFTQTIIPGVKDGLKALGKTKEPPIILRAHDSNAPEVMKASKPLYSNLYTMAKYNGEALTTYTPRGSWAKLHQELSASAPVQVENVHILANLEPFRYGADDFIQKCVQAMHKIYGSNGLHIYPQASYWDWPYSADKAGPRLLEMDRDWIWYATWARYAWNADRPRAKEFNYWAGQISEKYGSNQSTGASILTAYEQSGEIAPKLLRRYGITDGNRQTLTLGMLMSQLIHPTKYGLFTLLYESEAPPGEMITTYAENEWLHRPHHGETPVQVATEVVAHARNAAQAIEKASAGVHKNKMEFSRLKNDMLAYQQLAIFYSQKVTAALSILRYGYSHDIRDLEKALPAFDSSFAAFKKLTTLTTGTYLYANSMQTGGRKIPLSGQGGKYKTWAELLPVYQTELSNFKKNLASLKTHAGSNARQLSRQPLEKLPDGLMDWQTPDAVAKATPEVQIYSVAGDITYQVQKGGQPFSDTLVTIDTVADKLRLLSGIQVSKAHQIQSGTHLHFRCQCPVTLWVGYFTGKDKVYLKEPELETDASANDYDQAATKIANALVLPGFSGVNVHSFNFDKGENVLQLPRGACMLLGFTTAGQQVIPFDAVLGTDGMHTDLDWLFQ